MTDFGLLMLGAYCIFAAFGLFWWMLITLWK